MQHQSPDSWWSSWKSNLLSQKYTISEDDSLARILRILEEWDNVLLERISSFIMEIDHKEPDNRRDKNNFVTCILKPVGNKCNLTCRYCWECKEINHSESESIIEYMNSVFNWLHQGGVESLQLAWHGGEPTLTPIYQFEEWLFRIEKLNCFSKLTHILQTNGTLLDENYLTLLKKYGFSIGISCDGPPYLNDKNRFFFEGKGSGSKIEKAMVLCQELNVKFSILLTVTNDNAKYAGECWDYFLRFNPVEIVINPCRSVINIDNLSETNNYENYTMFSIDILKLWLNTPGSQKNIPMLSPLRDFLSNFSDIASKNCAFSSNCGSIFQLDSNGKISPCMLLENEKDHLIDIDFCNNTHQFNNKLFDLKSQRKIFERCKNCIWLSNCNNSCPIVKNSCGISFMCPKTLWDEFARILSEDLSNKVSAG